MYDIIVLGAGPAGISAALYAKRANLNVLVLFHGESQLEKAHLIENYYGFESGISGAALYKTGIAQARNLGVEVLETEATGIQYLDEKSYSVATSAGEFSAHALIIATGNKKLKPAIPGITELEGKGVSYCAVCDGFFYRKKDVCVIGSGRYALEEARHLANIANKVTILSNASDFSSEMFAEINRVSADLSGKISVDTRKIAKLSGTDHVEGVEFEDGMNLSVSGVFIALGCAGGADFAKKLGLELDGDNIKVDEKMATNAKGIFAAGNVNGGLLQVCKAVYEGGIAGLTAVEYVRGLK